MQWFDIAGVEGGAGAAMGQEELMGMVDKVDYPAECIILARAELANLRSARVSMIEQLRVLEDWIRECEGKLRGYGEGVRYDDGRGSEVR